MEVAVADLRQPKSRNFLKGNEGKQENHGKPLETHTRYSMTGPKNLLIRNTAGLRIILQDRQTDKRTCHVILIIVRATIVVVGNNSYYIMCECVSVVLVIQHAMRMRSIVWPSVPCTALQYFSTLSHNRHDFR